MGVFFMLKSVIFVYLKNRNLYFGTVQTNKVDSNDDQRRVYQNCKFHVPSAAVFVLGRDHISHILKMHFSL